MHNAGSFLFGVETQVEEVKFLRKYFSHLSVFLEDELKELIIVGPDKGNYHPPKTPSRVIRLLAEQSIAIGGMKFADGYEDHRTNTARNAWFAASHTAAVLDESGEDLMWAYLRRFRNACKSGHLE